MVAAGRHRRIGPEPVPHDDVPHGRRVVGSVVGDRLHRHGPPAPRHRVGGEERHRAGVGQPGRDGGRGEPREDRDDDRADLADGVEARDGLDRHRKEEPDRISAPHPQLEEGACEAVRLGRELAVRDALDRPVLALPDDRRAVGGVAVDAVVGEVHRAAGEPGRPRRSAGGVEHTLVGLEELDPQEADGRVPEPLDVVLAAPDQLAPVRDAVLAHERGGVRVLEHLGRRLPDVGVVRDAEDATERAA